MIQNSGLSGDVEREGGGALLVLFCKAPEAGAVKTRLLPCLSKEATARLHAAFITDTLHLTDGLGVQRALACAPSIHHPFFVECAREHVLRRIQQTGDDLGERMKNVLTWGFSEGFAKIVLIGCDSPTLPEAFIREAFGQLSTSPCVLGPSGDGGYYLIGASALAADLIPDLLSGISWGTGRVMTETLRKLNAKNVSCALLPFWYDIDRPDDLDFLKEHLALLERQGEPTPRATQAVMQSLSA